jgi:DNA-binding GntR family transcriptional regulator
MTLATNLVDVETLRSRIAALIRQYVIEMKPGYEPGSRLNPREMARQFGVSETPLKLALQELSMLGLVEVLPRRGTYVCRLSRRDVDELLDVRAGLEVMALRMVGGQIPDGVLDQMLDAVRACEAALREGAGEEYRRHDARFHNCIVEASGNRRLKQVYESLTHSVQILNVYNPRNVSHQVESQLEHKALVGVFRQGDPAQSEAALLQHWEGSKRRLLEGFKPYLSADGR